MIGFLRFIHGLLGIIFLLQIFGLVVSLILLNRSSEYHAIIFFILRIFALLVSGGILFWLRTIINRLHVTRYGVPHPRYTSKQASASGTLTAARSGEGFDTKTYDGVSRRTRLGLAALTLIGGIVLTDITMHGLTLGSACGWGFGARHQTLVNQKVASVFSEPLSAEYVIENFSCGGFQDLSVSFKLRLPNAEGRALAAALTRTFESGYSHPRFMGKPDITRMVQPGATGLIFTLPGVGGLHVRKLVMHLPDDPSLAVTLEFEGFQV
jgi:hypothetical protein